MVKGSFTADNKLIYLGEARTGASKTYELITTHPDGVRNFCGIVTLGSDINKCYVNNFYGKIQLYNLEGTNKVYIRCDKFRRLKYQLLAGEDCVHDVIPFNTAPLPEYKEMTTL